MGSRPMVVVVTGVLGLQLLVPAIALVAPEKPNRLGWQMYSGLGVDELVVTNEEGVELEVSVEDILPRAPRPELDWTRHLPEHLCTHVDADEVTVTVGPNSRTVSC